MVGDILQIVLIVIVLCFTFIGSNRGLVLSLLFMVKGVLTMAAALGIAPVIMRYLPEDLMVREGISFVIGLAVATLVFTLLVRLVKIADDTPAIGTLNKLGGAVFGAMVGVVVVWIFLAILGLMKELSWCQDIIKSARENRTVMWFQNSSPITWIFRMLGFPLF